MTVLFKRGAAAVPEDVLQLRRLEYTMQAVAADQNHRTAGERDEVVVDGQGGARPDRHREDVAHRVMFEAVLIQTERTAHFVDPGLIVGNDLKTLVIEDVGAGIANAGNGELSI